jgi:hypothetical protein
MPDEPETLVTPRQEGCSKNQHEKPLSGGGRWQLIMDDLNSYFKKGLFILVGIFIVLAAFGLYFSINSIIDRWVEFQYAPLVQTVYYIAIIALGLYLMKIYILKK